MTGQIPLDSGLLRWSLATFHASTLVLVLVFVLYAIGDLSGLLNGEKNGDMGTLAGLGAFALLWTASLIGTTRALPPAVPGRITANSIADLMGWGAMGGAISGALFLAGIAIAAVPLVISSSISEGQGAAQVFAALTFLAFFALIGGFVAAIIGAAVGILTALLDGLIFGVALIISSPLPAPLAPDSETPAT